MSIFTGCATALVTPFTDNGVDFEAFGRFLDFQIESGVNALVVLGTTGEAATMAEEEKVQTVKFAMKKVAGRVPVIVGTGSNNTAEAIRYSKKIEDLGVDGLLVVTPYYNKCTQEGLIAHYNAVADAVRVPIIAYNVPGRTGVNILPSTFAEIAKHERVVAIKEASGNMEQIADTIRLCKGYADVISGDDGITVPIMSVGGTGVISVLSNVIPRFVSEMCADALEGRFKKAADKQLHALPLIKALFSETNPIPAKYAVSSMGFGANIPRLPLTPMTKANAEKLHELLHEFIGLHDD